MCSDCDQCFSEEEKKKLTGKGWSDKEIAFAENSIIENRIKKLI